MALQTYGRTVIRTICTQHVPIADGAGIDKRNSKRMIESQTKLFETGDEAPPPPVIHTENLGKQFGEETAVTNLNLDVPEGVIFGFIGPSGCGKTTTVRMLLGVYEPTTGSAQVLGCDPRNFKREQQEKIGYMPQLFVLYPELSVRENLNFAASLYGVTWRRKERLRELLELVELTGHEGKLVRNISGGMRRRLSMAAALVHQPTLLFMDEPTAGIDPVLRRTFWDYFATLKEEGRTLFVTTQYVGEAAYCDYVGVMIDGRLVTVDTPTQLRRQALGGDVIQLETEADLAPQLLAQLRRNETLAIIDVQRQSDRKLHIVVENASTTMPLLANWFHENNVGINTLNEYAPPFDDVFVQLVKEANHDVAQNDAE